MEIRSKIRKLQTHENLHKNVNENVFSFWHILMQIFMSFYEAQFKQLVSYMLFHPFKIAVQFWWSKMFFFQKLEKSLKNQNRNISLFL